MGICAHMGIAFHPQDEAIAVAVVSGESDDSDWAPLHNTDFGLVRENYWLVHRVLETLAANDVELAPLATAIIGTRRVAEVGHGVLCLYHDEEMRGIADAFARISDEAISDAIDQISLECHPAEREGFCNCIRTDLQTVRRETELVASNGWSMIGGMF